MNQKLQNFVNKYGVMFNAFSTIFVFSVLIIIALSSLSDTSEIRRIIDLNNQARTATQSIREQTDTIGTRLERVDESIKHINNDVGRARQDVSESREQSRRVAEGIEIGTTRIERIKENISKAKQDISELRANNKRAREVITTIKETEQTTETQG